VIRVRLEHVVRTVDVLRSCGRGRRECVAYWLAALAVDRAEVANVVHPVHTSTAGGYRVDSSWLTKFFFRLADDGQRVVAQVHTHPADRIEHSSIDDEFGLVPSPGFVSIVVPNFGLGPIDPTTWNVEVLQRSGEWRPGQKVIEW
jgi:proteasome lid subunit RPN8/RPN11